MREPGDAKLESSECLRVRAAAELPQELKQRLEEVGMGAVVQTVDAEAEAALAWPLE